MRNFDGIIFDVDGTLTSTNELIFASFNHIAAKYHNRQYSNDEIIALFGPTEDIIIRQWCPDNYEEARKDYYDFYESNHHMADLYPGIKDLLKQIKSRDVLLSIYTGKGRDAAVITLKTLGIFDYFDMVITGDDVKVHKPSKEGILTFTEKFNIPLDKVLMIGDAPADVKAARSAGVRVASVVWDSYAKAEVLDLGADHIFESVDELENFVLGNI